MPLFPSARALALCVTALALFFPTVAQAQAPPEFRVLVFNRAAGFVHQSIPVATSAISTLGAGHGFAVDATNDPSAFTDANLSRYAAVVFLHTTGDVLPGAAERAAFERYIRGGGGFLGVHAASDMGSAATSWPFYRELVGAVFKGHTRARFWADVPLPRPVEGPLSAAPDDAETLIAGGGITLRLKTWEPARVWVEDPLSPAMQGWGGTFTREDEWFGFSTNPRPDVHVLASLDEDSYNAADGDMGPGAADHPIAWCRRYEGGRSIYNAMGHNAGAWREPEFLESILGAIEMAAGVAPFNCPTRQADGTVGGTVVPTLSLTLGPAPSFGTFVPGVTRVYEAEGTATVTSTGADAALTVADPSPQAPGQLVNGAWALPQRVHVGGQPVGGVQAPARVREWTGPVAAEQVPLRFTQAIDASDGLRTGHYGKTLVLTLSTTAP